MKKPASLVLTALLLLAVLAGCQGSPEQGGTLNLFTWEGMFPQELLEAFESDTGIRVNFVNFDFSETMLAKLEAANGGDYDLVIADDYIIETVISEGLAQKLDTSRFKNYGNINPLYQGRFFDPEDEYTIPYGAGVQTIVYNPARVSKTITGYADLWDESLRDSIGVVGNYRVINGMALKVAGKSYNTEDAADITQAGELLVQLAPNIRLIKDDSIQDDLLSGEISAAVMYTSQVTAAMLADPSLEVVYPAEGIGFGIMGAFVPSAAPNADAAYAFLDYLMDARNAASGFEWLGYYSTNKAADAFINDDYKPFLTLPSDFGGDMEMIQGIGADAEALHSRIWVEFKTACGQ